MAAPYGAPKNIMGSSKGPSSKGGGKKKPKKGY